MLDRIQFGCDDFPLLHFASIHRWYNGRNLPLLSIMAGGCLEDVGAGILRCRVCSKGGSSEVAGGESDATSPETGVLRC